MVNGATSARSRTSSPLLYWHKKFRQGRWSGLHYLPPLKVFLKLYSGKTSLCIHFDYFACLYFMLDASCFMFHVSCLIIYLGRPRHSFWVTRRRRNNRKSHRKLHVSGYQGIPLTLTFTLTLTLTLYPYPFDIYLTFFLSFFLFSSYLNLFIYLSIYIYFLIIY